jgi:indolepyruvate ferredoxin oxidoreductase
VQEHEPAPKTLEEIVRYRAALLVKYQDTALAARYHARIEVIAEVERKRTPGKTGLAEAVAKAYHKLLAYKDEYEVARLYTDGAFAREIAAQFDGVKYAYYYLAPPLLSRLWRDKATGHPRKIRLPGALVMPMFHVLARLRGLRGTAFDVFGYSAERRREREAITDYERLLDEITERLTVVNHETAVALAKLPLEIKGYGHVKEANAVKARDRQYGLLARFRAVAPPREQSAAPVQAAE